MSKAVMGTSRDGFAAGAFSALILIFLLSFPPAGASGQQILTMKELFARATSGEPKFQELRTEAREDMLRRKSEALPYLSSKLVTHDATVRNGIKDIFLQMGNDGIPFLTGALKSRDWRMASAAAWILEEMKEKKGAQALAGILGNENWRVRQAALSALGEIGDSSFADAIVPLLSDQNELVRKSAAYALGQLKWTGSPEKLTFLLGDNFYGVRYSAGYALSWYGDENAAKLIDLFKKKQDRLTKYHLIEIIGETRSQEALAFLLSLTGDPDVFTRAFTAGMLAYYTDKPGVSEALDKLARDADLLVRSEALASLENSRSGKTQ